MKKISNKLRELGAEIIIEPHAFYVEGKDGPLINGEKEKATVWARKIKDKISE